MSEPTGKVKTRRDDFVVDEISNFSYHKAKPGRPPRPPRDASVQSSATAQSSASANSHAVYQLSKSGIGTIEACDEVMRAWSLPRKALGYAGRKDRHAHTTQLVTLCDGPNQGYEATKFSLNYLGQAARPITAKDIKGNRFQVTLRDLTAERATRLSQQATNDAPLVPNYFDEQRFGSVCIEDQFPAAPWCLGDYEKATYLALAEDNTHDSSAERKQRAILREHWGDWTTCKATLERGNRRSVITYLVDHPQGFKKAAALIHRDLRSLFVSALQSRLWNEVVARWLPRHFPNCREWSTLETAGGTLAFPCQPIAATEEIQSLKIPLPSSRPTRWPKQTLAAKELLEEVCQGFGLTTHKLRFSHPRDVFFSRMERSVFLDIDEWNAEASDDELHVGKSKLVLRFRLGPGQYATMLLKALQLA